ncbi:MAG: DNA polymerase III subunit delta [Gammaproteobacteria bacterium]|nr:DNA polymerase III subunit delta [Gammaproteobacteria bacterium]
MRCTADRLPAQLAKTLSPLYVLSSDEPLLLDEALEHIRTASRTAGCNERQVAIAERGFDWAGFGAGLQGLSLFSSRRLVELRIPTGKPGDAGAKFLSSLARAPALDDVVVVILPALDFQATKTAWATALAESAVWVELRAPGRDELPAWLARRLKVAGVEADDEALDLLASRVEGNLLAAKQEIDKFALLAGGGRLMAEQVRGDVADGARFDVFQLCEAALRRDVERTVRVLGVLEREGESDVLVLWALVRDIQTLADLAMRASQGRGIDQAMADMRLWRSRQEQFRQALRGRRLGEILAVQGSAAQADRILKGAARGSRWGTLNELALQLAGAAVPLAETA